MSSAKPILIIDNGSFEIKAGLSNQKKPQHVFPSIVAVEKGVDPKQQVPAVGVGKEALKKLKSKESIFSLRYPMQRGMIIEWDSLEHIYRYILSQEGVQSAASGALLTLNTDAPVEHKDGLAQMFLELFNMERVCVEIPSVLAAKSSSQLLGGMTGNQVNGMFVDLGSGLTTVTPIVDGQCNYKHVRKMNLAGQDVSLQLSRVMQQYSGYVLDSKEEYRIIQHVKHNMAYVCQDFNDELIGVKENPKQFLQQVELPNGEMLNLTKECFMGPEILFDPSLYGIQSNMALHKTILDIAATAAKENIDSLLKNIFVFGGTSSLPGLTDRLQSEIKKIIGKKKINVTALPQHVTWTGAQSGHPSLTNWISKQEYAEYGANIFLKKSKF